MEKIDHPKGLPQEKVIRRNLLTTKADNGKFDRPVWPAPPYIREVLRDAGKKVRWAGRDAMVTTVAMERFLHRLGVSGLAYRQWVGQGLREFISTNPGWRLRDWQLLVLENIKIITARR